ncbi:hypothetical protein NEISICOT_03456 [Neisseria sicca ATCC 29256]|uniref:Uncharacterized protein n=1 Tax=Neisseria sicca ATCC 29256 TaxID=547045 RepID=C6MA74_NEISI|nr:hypothetical protein NEISICOT_03456 [Neisseria sicca ATCC 29256]
MRYRGNRISDDVCLILMGTGRLKRIWQQLFFMFFFGGLGNACLCCHLFQTTFS